MTSETRAASVRTRLRKERMLYDEFSVSVAESNVQCTNRGVTIVQNFSSQSRLDTI